MVSTSFILFDHAGSQVNALDWIRFNSRDSRTPEPSNRDSRPPEISKQGRVSGLSAVSAVSAALASLGQVLFDIAALFAIRNSAMNLK